MDEENTVDVRLSCPECGSEHVRENFCTPEMLRSMRRRISDGEIPGWTCIVCGEGTYELEETA